MTDDMLGWPVPGGLIMEACPPGVCVVCGGPVPPTKCDRFLFESVTCHDPYCQTSLKLEPRLAAPRKYLEVKRAETRRRHAWDYRKATARQAENERQAASFLRETPDIIERADISRVLVELVRLRFDTSLWYIDNEWFGTDERGALDEYGQTESVWSKNSRLKIAFKVIGGSPAISIVCPLRENPTSVLLWELTQSDALPDHYDYFLVWRCGCPEAHEVRYRTPEDVPNRYGYHNHCAACWCAPIEVLRPGEKPLR